MIAFEIQVRKYSLIFKSHIGRKMNERNVDLTLSIDSTVGEERIYMESGQYPW